MKSCEGEPFCRFRNHGKRTDSVNSEVLEIFVRGICLAGYACLACQFCKKYLTCSGACLKKEWRIHLSESAFQARSNPAAVFFCAAVLFDYFIADIFCQKSSYLAGAVLLQLLFIGGVVLAFAEGWKKKALAAVLYLFLTKFTAKAVGSGFSMLTLAFFHAAGREPLISKGSPAELGIALLETALSLLLVYSLEKPLNSVFMGKPGSWYLVLSVPLILMIEIEDILEWSASRGILFQGRETGNIYQNQLLSHGANLILAVLCLCGAAFFIFGMERIYREQKQKERYQGQVEAYRMLEEQYLCMERLRHDMKNHVLGLRGLLERREWEKMEQYLQKMEEAGALAEPEETTGNHVVDVLLGQKRQRAKQASISWECQVQFGKHMEADDFDLCVILGNILDNAIDACEKSQGERWICVQSGIVKDFLLLEVKNSTEEKELPKPSKAAFREHGIGLNNVREAVEKYNGAVNIELKDQVFAISVLLPAVPSGSR